jgi:hypothetical protein
MCAERVQRIVIAILIGVSMGAAASGMTGESRAGLQVAFLIQLSLIVALLVGGFTGFCPSLRLLRQFLPPCEEK